jgi:hypothetical protein
MSCVLALCAAVLQAVRRAVLDLTVELIATSSTFIGNCLQVGSSCTALVAEPTASVKQLLC